MASSCLGLTTRSQTLLQHLALAEQLCVRLQALVAGVVAYGVFGMPILLAFTLGFILKAVGPAIVIQLMFDLQRKGRGVDKGGPLLLTAAPLTATWSDRCLLACAGQC